MALLVACGIVAIPAGAQSPPIVQLQYSADVSARFAPSAVFAFDHEYVIDAAGSLARASLPGLPERADLDALQIDADGAVLFSLDIGATLGGAYFDAADAIRYAGGSYTLAFDASAAGVRAGVNLDALARRSGNLLVSFDSTFTAGQIYRPADVIEVNAGVLGTKVLDAGVLVLPVALNIDAIDAINSTTHLLVSFDTGGQVGGITFADEDIMELTLAGSVWIRRFALLPSSDRWAAANLDALSAAANGDTLFANGFE